MVYFFLRWDYYTNICREYIMGNYCIKLHKKQGEVKLVNIVKKTKQGKQVIRFARLKQKVNKYSSDDEYL